MADDLHRALEDGRHFVREILDQVNAERCEKDGTPKLFPNGVRDIYAKVSIAGSFIEVEISGADGPHRGGGSVEVTGSDGMIVSLNRPMVVNPKDTNDTVTVTAKHNSETFVVQPGTIQELPLDNDP